MIIGQHFSSEIVYEDDNGNYASFDIAADGDSIHVTCSRTGSDSGESIFSDTDFIKTTLIDLGIRVMDTIILAKSMMIDKEFDNGFTHPIRVTIGDVTAMLDGETISYPYNL